MLFPWAACELLLIGESSFSQQVFQNPNDRGSESVSAAQSLSDIGLFQRGQHRNRLPIAIPIPMPQCFGCGLTALVFGFQWLAVAFAI
jgi:hypothetical protein